MLLLRASRTVISRTRAELAFGAEWATLVITGWKGGSKLSQAIFSATPLFDANGEWIGEGVLGDWLGSLQLPRGIPVSIILPAPAIRHLVVMLEQRPTSKRELHEVARWHFERHYGDMAGYHLRTTLQGEVLVAAAVPQSLLRSLEDVLEPNLFIISAESALIGLARQGSSASTRTAVDLTLDIDSGAYVVRDGNGRIVTLRTRWCRSTDEDLDALAVDLQRVLSGLPKADNTTAPIVNITGRAALTQRLAGQLGPGLEIRQHEQRSGMANAQASVAG